MSDFVRIDAIFKYVITLKKLTGKQSSPLAMFTKFIAYGSKKILPLNLLI